MARTIRIVGAPGSGKTVLRLALGAALDLPTYDIQEERRKQTSPGHHWPRDRRGPWLALARLVAGSGGRCIVETSGYSPEEAFALRGPLITIHCAVPLEVRRARLEARAGDPLVRDPHDYVGRMLAYSDAAPAGTDLTWDGQGSLTGAAFQVLVDQCRARLKEAA